MNSDYWSQSVTGSGIVQIGTEDSYNGSHHLFIGQNLQSNQSDANAVLSINLAGQIDVFMDFWWRHTTNTGVSATSGVYVSGDNGINWVKAINFDKYPRTYRHELLNLNKFATDHGLTLNSQFKIWFYFKSYEYSGGSSNGTGIRIDDLRLVKRLDEVASFPFKDSFEADTMQKGWFAQPTQFGVVETSDSDPFSGKKHIFLGQTTANTYSSALLELAVDLANQSDIYLDFWWRLVGDTAISGESGLYMSSGDGLNWTKLISFNTYPRTYGHELLNLKKVATDNGLTLGNNSRVYFYYKSYEYSGGSGVGSGIRVDDISLTTRAEEIVQYPTQQDFEVDRFEQGWFPSTWQFGIAEISSDEPHLGNNHAFLGQTTVSNNSGARLMLATNLNGQTDVYLDFWWRSVGNSAIGGGSSVYISSDEGANWLPIFSFNTTVKTYKHESIDLVQAASNNGLRLNDRFRVLFQYQAYEYSGGSASGTGIRIDDIQLVPKAQSGGTPIPTRTPTGTVQPTLTPTPTQTSTQTRTPAPTATHTLTPKATSTSTETSVSTATSTATATSTPTATKDPNQKPPVINEVKPNQGSNDQANEIHLYGENFVNGTTVSLGTTLLAVTFIDSTHLQAIVPAGLAAGEYDVNVTNPGIGSVTLPKGYHSLDLASNDDLTSNSELLWTEPAALHAQSPGKVGLRVSRQGGKQALQNVTVDFYLGNPQSGGTLIGQQSLDTFSPNSEENFAVDWTPPSEGQHTIYARIDPDNSVSETFENNNLIVRTLDVLPALADQNAPHVDSFSINGGTESTSEQKVKLSTTASDPGSPSTGISKVLYVEYEHSSSADQWIRVRSSGWLDFATASSNHEWLLTPSSGMKYLQAWVSDNAGNVSLFPEKKFINFMPEVHKIGRNQRKVFRFELKAGEKLSARLEAVSGDPDLYIWSPQEGSAPWVSNLSTGVDDYTISAPVDGNYQIEIYGFSAAEFKLIVTQATLAEALSSASVQGGVDPNKPQPSAPPVANDETPSNQVAINAPGVTRNQIFLPLVNR